MKYYLKKIKASTQQTITLMILVASILFASKIFAMETAFYILRSDHADQIEATKKAYASLSKHASAIDVLISQAYQVDENGVVEGFIDPDVLKFAQQHATKLMALITNENFDRDKVHLFLNHPQAQDMALQSIVTACQQNHLYGVQFDFEDVLITDRNALTQFFLKASQFLHHENLVVSFAVSPTLTDGVQPSLFFQKIYTNWEGAFDFKALAETADFVTIMAYDQHASVTTPGPTAGINWVEATIKYALQMMPAKKISLGIPAYSTYWYTGRSPENKISMQMDMVAYDQAEYILQKYHGNLQWRHDDQVNFSMFSRNFLNEFLFLEDVDSFKAKLAMAQKYHLHGISVYSLGFEDPRIWQEIKR